MATTCRRALRCSRVSESRRLGSNVLIVVLLLQSAAKGAVEVRLHARVPPAELREPGARRPAIGAFERGEPYEDQPGTAKGERHRVATRGADQGRASGIEKVRVEH